MGTSLMIPAPQFLTLFLSFDVGQSYVFEVHTPTRGKDAPWEWQRHFPSGSGWNCSQPRATFGKPLGWRVTLEIRDDTCPELRGPYVRLCRALRRVVPGAECASARAIFFPLGIGVLVLTLRIHNPLKARLASWQDIRKVIKPYYDRMIEGAGHLYLARMRRASRDTERVTLRPLAQVARAGPMQRAASIYPLSFGDDTQLELALRKDSDEARRRRRQARYGESRIYVGWAEGHVSLATPDDRARIEEVFLVAMVSWYALRLMDKLLSSYLLDAFVGIASRNRKLIEVEVSRVRRLLYMDAANAAHPIRWTVNDQDLFLLEAIHRNWSSHRWWKNIEERTRLLALHHHQLEAGEAEARADNTARITLALTVLGICVAGFTFASTIIDVTQAFQAKSYKLGLLAVLFPLSAAAVLIYAFIAHLWKPEAVRDNVPAGRIA